MASRSPRTTSCSGTTDIYQNKELVPTPAPEFTINGKPGRMSKRDDYTVVFEFPEPYFLFVDILAGDTLIGGGQATGMARASFMGGYAPAHYLKQFLPKYSSADEVTRKAKAAGFDSWVSYFRNRTNWALNTELPVLGPWKTVSPINTPTWAMERNPYYWAVDTGGQPTALHRPDRHGPGGEPRGPEPARHRRRVRLPGAAYEPAPSCPSSSRTRRRATTASTSIRSQSGCDAALLVNTAYEADPEIAKWLTNRDFRHALALGIDRDQLNEAFWLGIGTPGSCVPGRRGGHQPREGVPEEVGRRST